MAKKVSILGLMLSIAMIFSYIEHLVPLNFIAPGVKLGLANCVVLTVLFTHSVKYAALINLVRIILSALIFGNPISLIFSLSGAAVSLFAAWIIYKHKLLSPSGLGAVSGVCHNLAQLIAAAFVTGSLGVFWYAPVLIVSGTLCGILTAVTASKIAEKKI